MAFNIYADPKKDKRQSTDYFEHVPGEVPAVYSMKDPVKLATQEFPMEETPVKLATQEFPRQDLTAASSAVPRAREGRTGTGDQDLDNVPFSVGGNTPPVPRGQQIRNSLLAIDGAIAAGHVPTAQQAEQISSLKQQAGYAQGGTDRVPVGPDGRPVSSGNTDINRRMGEAGYSFKGSPDAAKKFLEAPPVDRSPEGVAANNQQRMQFLERQGFERVDPRTGMTPSQVNKLPVEKRIQLATMLASNDVEKGRLAIERDRLAQSGEQFGKAQEHDLNKVGIMQKHDLTRDSNKAKQDMLMADKNQAFLTQKDETERAYKTGSEQTSDNRKLAMQLMMQGRGGSDIEKLYNAGSSPRIAGIQPVTQKSEAQAGYKVHDVKIPGEKSIDPEKVRTVLINEKDPNDVRPINIPGQTPVTGDKQPEEKPFVPDPEELSVDMNMINGFNSAEESAKYLALIKRRKPEYYNYLKSAMYSKQKQQ